MTDTRVVNLNHGTAYDVYIGRANPRRGLQASPFANPFKVGRDGSRGEVVAKYLQWLQGQPALLARLPELQGKVLGCWCAPEQCHGHILAALADSRHYEAS